MTDQPLSEQDLAAIEARVRAYQEARLGITDPHRSHYAQLEARAAMDAERLLSEVHRLRAELAKHQP
jgi:hypothetical protein